VQDRLQQHVYNLADRIGERNVWHYASLVAAATYLEEELLTLGYAVKTQAYAARKLTVKNLEAELTGVSQPAEIIIVGAHYDSVLGSPGANDNGSGVAALLEIARLLADQKLPRPYASSPLSTANRPSFTPRRWAAGFMPSAPATIVNLSLPCSRWNALDIILTSLADCFRYHRACRQRIN